MQVNSLTLNPCDIIIPFNNPSRFLSYKKKFFAQLNKYFLKLYSKLIISHFFLSIPNLEDGIGAPCIPVYGCSLLPYCHFDLEDSDYLSRRSPDLQDPVNPNTRVLEFKTVGLLAASTR